MMNKCYCPESDSFIDSSINIYIGKIQDTFTQLIDSDANSKYSRINSETNILIQHHGQLHTYLD